MPPTEEHKALDLPMVFETSSAAMDPAMIWKVEKTWILHDQFKEEIEVCLVTYGGMHQVFCMYSYKDFTERLEKITNQKILKF